MALQSIEEVPEDEENEEEKTHRPSMRFYNADHSEVKCFKCKGKGHFSFTCTEVILPLCFTCGDKGHESMSCPDWLKCRRCQQSGHKVQDCKEQDVCKACSKVGHLEDRCLTKKLDFITDQIEEQPICMLCFKPNHLKCQSEMQSLLVDIDNIDISDVVNVP